MTRRVVAGTDKEGNEQQAAGKGGTPTRRTTRSAQNVPSPSTGRFPSGLHANYVGPSSGRALDHHQFRWPTEADELTPASGGFGGYGPKQKRALFVFYDRCAEGIL